MFARVHFADEASLETAKAHDLTDLYERAYLTGADETRTTHGQTRLDLDNKICAVSGVGAKSGRKLALDETMAVNCTAGACSIGDGFSVNYNAVKINACCPSCIKMLVAAPEKFLPNLQPEIDAALKPETPFQEKKS